MQRSSVVLPEPDRPMIITASRCRTSRSTPRSTWFVPKYFSSCPTRTIGSPMCVGSGAPVVPARGRCRPWAEIDERPIRKRRIGHRSPLARRRSRRSWKRLKMIVRTQYDERRDERSQGSSGTRRGRCSGPATGAPGRVMIETSELSLIIAMNSLPIAGITIRIACGRTIRRNVCDSGMPSACAASLLAARHGLDAGTEDLGHVGAVVEAERDDPGRDRREDDAGLRQGEIDEEDLDEQRRAADERDVQRGDRIDHRVRAEPPERAEEGQDGREHDRQDGHEDRDPDPAEDVRAALER